jgi:hypothetical protein
LLGIKNKKLKAFQASACGLLGSSAASKLLIIYLGEGEVFMQSTDFYENFVNNID